VTNEQTNKIMNTEEKFSLQDLLESFEIIFLPLNLFPIDDYD